MHALPQHVYPLTHAIVQCPAPLELPELPPPELEDELALDPAPLLPLELELPELPPELPLAEPELPLAEPELPLAEPELLFELLPADPEPPPPSVVASPPPASVDASLPAVNVAPPQWDTATRATNESEPKQRDGFILSPNSRSNCDTHDGKGPTFGPNQGAQRRRVAYTAA